MLVNKIEQTGNGHRGFGTKVKSEQVELNSGLDDWTLAHYIHGENESAKHAAAKAWVEKYPTPLSSMKPWGRTADYAARKMVEEAGA